MTKILKVTLASVMLIAGSSMAFAADNDGRSNVGDRGAAGFNDKGRSSEQQKLFELDDTTTGSISPCDSQMWDENGNCVADPGYQNMQ